MFFGFLSNGVSMKKYVDVPLFDESLTCLLFSENRVNNNALTSFLHINKCQPQRSLSKRFFLEEECV